MVKLGAHYTNAGSCVIGPIDNKKPALGGLGEAQTLRSFLTPTRDSSPAMMPSSHTGEVGTDVGTVVATIFDSRDAESVPLPMRTSMTPTESSLLDATIMMYSVPAVKATFRDSLQAEEQSANV